MQSKFINITNIYLILICMLLLQDTLYEAGSGISKAFNGLFILYSIVITIYANLHYKLPKYFNGLNLLLAMFTIYGIILMTKASSIYRLDYDLTTPTYAYLRDIFKSLLPIYVFYVGAVRKDLSQKGIQKWVIIILLLSTTRFIAHYFTSTSYFLVDEITNNYGYLFVGIITLLVFFNDKTKTQYFLTAICMLMVILSMKRGAILVACVCLIPFTFTMWKNGNRRKRLTIGIMAIAFLIGCIYLVQYLLQTSDYFLVRAYATLEGDSSARDTLFYALWQHFTEAPLAQQIFGGGAEHTLYILSIHAHNDWLEILTNQGIMGIIIYMIYWRFWRKEQQLCNHITALSISKTGLAMCFLASFMMTLFSMSYGNLPIGISMTLGICLGQITRYQTHQELNIG